MGVGTGWYLDHCRFPQKETTPRVGLLDFNPYSLAAAARRITRYRPELYQANVLRPVRVEARPFRSVALTYLLHCLPGPVEEKAAAVFDNLALLLEPDGVVFGATLLSAGVERSWAARTLMRAYNRNGVFSNEADSLAGLKTALDRRFRIVELEVVGCVALFAGRGAEVRRGESASVVGS